MRMNNLRRFTAFGVSMNSDRPGEEHCCLPVWALDGNDAAEMAQAELANDGREDVRIVYVAAGHHDNLIDAAKGVMLDTDCLPPFLVKGVYGTLQVDRRSGLITNKFGTFEHAYDGIQRIDVSNAPPITEGDELPVIALSEVGYWLTGGTYAPPSHIDM
jgi:hypothetical protein